MTKVFPLTVSRFWLTVKPLAGFFDGKSSVPPSLDACRLSVVYDMEEVIY